MKKLIIALAAVATVSAAAAPAAAAPGPGPAWQSINQRQDRIEQQIERGVRQGHLTRREAAKLREEFKQIARLEARYRVNGLTTWERNDLDRRLARLETQLRFELRDHKYSRR